MHAHDRQVLHLAFIRPPCSSLNVLTHSLRHTRNRVDLPPKISLLNNVVTTLRDMLMDV